MEASWSGLLQCSLVSTAGLPAKPCLQKKYESKFLVLSYILTAFVTRIHPLIIVAEAAATKAGLRQVVFFPAGHMTANLSLGPANAVGGIGTKVVTVAGTHTLSGVTNTHCPFVSWVLPTILSTVENTLAKAKVRAVRHANIHRFIPFDQPGDTGQCLFPIIFLACFLELKGIESACFILSIAVIILIQGIGTPLLNSRLGKVVHLHAHTYAQQKLKHQVAAKIY